MRSSELAGWRVLESFGRYDKLVERTVPRSARSKDRTLPETSVARAISDRHPGSKARQWLLTSLNGPKQYPALEIVAMYHERWEIELGYDEINTHLLEREETIRSKTVLNVRQELWGILLTYNLVRLEMQNIAGEVQLPPTRISFVAAMRFIRDEWGCCAVASPGSIPKKRRRMREKITAFLLPERRSERRYPRAVKIKISNYPKKRRNKRTRRAKSSALGLARVLRPGHMRTKNGATCRCVSLASTRPRQPVQVAAPLFRVLEWVGIARLPRSGTVDESRGGGGNVSHVFRCMHRGSSQADKVGRASGGMGKMTDGGKMILDTRGPRTVARFVFGTRQGQALSLAGLVGVMVGLLAPAASHADRGDRLSLSMDQVLVRADFIGEIEVMETTAVDGLFSVRVRVVDPWFSRWPSHESMELRARPDFSPMAQLAQGGRAVVLLSGGAWQQSPFTHRANSVFQVTSGRRVACRSGNPLFAVTDAGFHCSIPELTAGSPLTVAQMRASTLSVRGRAVRRLGGLARLLDGLARPLRLAPGPAGPSAPELQVIR